MAEVAQRLGINVKTLRKNYPVICKTISKRYLEYKVSEKTRRFNERSAIIRQLMYEMNSQNIYPSRRLLEAKIEEKLGLKRIFIEAQYHKVWSDTLKELGSIKWPFRPLY